jgi:hypothetical protein
MPAHSDGYACATSARGGSGASRAQRTAGDVRAPLPAAMPAGSGRARKARLICSGAAGRLNCLMGVQLGFMGVQLGGKGHLGWFAGAAAAGRGLPGNSGRLSPCLPDDGAPRCGCAVRSWPAARFRLTAVIVSAGQVLGLVMRSGGGAAIRLWDADPGGPCRVSFDW